MKSRFTALLRPVKRDYFYSRKWGASKNCVWNIKLLVYFQKLGNDLKQYSIHYISCVNLRSKNLNCGWIPHQSLSRVWEYDCKNILRYIVARKRFTKLGIKSSQLQLQVDAANASRRHCEFHIQLSESTWRGRTFICTRRDVSASKLEH